MGWTALQLIVVAALAAASPVAQTSAFQRRFDQFDHNGDGKITAGELRMPNVFTAADKNGNDAISPEEFATYVNTRRGVKGRRSQDAAPTADSVKETEIRYAKTPGVEANLQSLDIYAPKAAENAPVMIYVHGGGWRKGDKAGVGNKPSFFNGKGWVFVSTNYRLVPHAEFPENVADVARAIDWVCRNICEYGGDPNKIFIMGHSAGAHLVSLVATDPTYLETCGRTLKDVKGVISLDTQAYDLLEMLDGWTSDVYSGAFGKDPRLHKLASPQHHVDAGRSIPPFMVCYSQGVPVERVSKKRCLLYTSDAADDN